MFDIVLGTFLFLSPIFFLPKQIGNINALQFYQFGVLGNMGYNYLQLQFFCYGIVALFIVALLSKPQREFNNKWMVVLFSLFCLNVYFHPIGIKMFAPVLLGFLLYYLVVVYTKDYKRLFKFIFCASLLNTVFAILQFFNINLLYHSTGRIDGLMCLSTHLGAYQAIVLPICYALNPFFVIVPIIGIVLSKSITAIFILLCWLIAISFTGIKIKDRIFNISSFCVSMSLLTLTILFLLHNWNLILQKINIRITVWIPALKDIFNRFFLGYGLKPFSFNSPIGLYENTCSIYLGIAWCLGILVLIPLFMLIKDIFKSKNLILLTSILTALIIGIEKSIFDYPRLLGTTIILFGFLAVAKGAEYVNQV